MGKSWIDTSTPAGRARLSWIGGGVVAVATGAWTAITYFWPAHDGKGGVNCAQNAAVANQGDMGNVTINANGATFQGNGSVPCGNPAPK